MERDFLAVAAATVSGVTAARWLMALLGATVAAWSDFRTRRIPNMLTFPMLLAGLGVATMVGGWNGLGDAVAGMLLLGLPYFLLFAFAGGGAGDSKIMGAIGAWVGFTSSIPVLVGVAICGGLLAIAYAILKKQLGPVAENLRTAIFGIGLAAMDGGRARRARDFMPATTAPLKMPYGVAIFVGTLCAAGWVLLWK